MVCLLLHASRKRSPKRQKEKAKKMVQHLHTPFSSAPSTELLIDSRRAPRSIDTMGVIAQGCQGLPFVTTGMYPQLITIPLSRKSLVSRVHLRTSNICGASISVGGTRVFGYTKMIPSGSSSVPVSTQGIDMISVEMTGASKLTNLLELSLEGDSGEGFGILWRVDVEGVAE